MTSVYLAGLTSADEWQEDLAETLKAYREAHLWDRHDLHEPTQRLMTDFLVKIGRLVLHKVEFELPELAVHQLQDAARHFGNDILGKVGDDQRRQLAQILVDSNNPSRREYAADCACGVVDTAMTIWYADQALRAYRQKAESEDDEDLVEQIERAREDLEQACSNYYTGLQTADGFEMLQWAAKVDTSISNQRVRLPAGTEIPWWLNF